MTPDPDDDLQDRAALFDRNGWGPIPLPTGKKAQPPTGFTGADAPRPTFSDWYAVWDGARAAWGNLGVRVPENVVGVDIDAYNGKNGAATWDALGGGDWPRTWRLSARFSPDTYDQVSGIRFYRLPAGITQDMLWGAHDGIEILRFGHRYAVAPGSTHPEGGQYRLFDEAQRQWADTLPPIDSLPELTVQQATRLTVNGAPWRAAPTDEAPRARDTNPMCAYTTTLLNRCLGELKTSDSRYGTMSTAVYALIMGEDEGHHLGEALDILRLAYFSATAADRKKANAESPLSEFDRNVAGARAKAAELPTDPMFQGCCGERTEEPPEPMSTSAPEGEPEEERSAWDMAVARKYSELRLLQEAKERLNEFNAGKAEPLELLPWPAFSAQPDEEETYRVTGLWPAEGRVLLAAAAKTGKTTLVAANLIPSLLDGRPFLGTHEVTPVTGAIVYLNMEVGPRTLRRWMADAGVPLDDRLIVVNLRGKASSLSLSSPQGRQKFSAILRAVGAEIVILDPLAPLLASLGLDENSNTDVARFFSWWGEALGDGGVTDDLVVHHTGHAGQRSRGASRLLDEPDAVWTVTRDDDDDEGDELDALLSDGPTRYLQAYGRDVDLPAEALEYDPQTRALVLTGQRKGQESGKKLERRILTLMSDMTPRNATQIKAQMGKGGSDAKWKAIQSLVASGDLFQVGRSKNGYPIYALGKVTP